MRISQNLSPRLCLMALAFGSALVAGCQAAEQETAAVNALADVRSRGVLRVATLNAPTTWYLGTHGPEGLEYELARDFARKLGVKLDMNAVADVGALRRALQSGTVDLVAAQITPDESWQSAGLASEPYDEIAQQWVYRRGRPKPRSLTEIAAARIVVGQDSPEAQVLQKHAGGLASAIEWLEIPRGSEIDPFDAVSEGIADVALVDAYRLVFQRALHPDIAVAMPFPHKRPVAWMVPNNGATLVAAINNYFSTERRSGRLARRISRWTATSSSIRSVTAREFRTLHEERLPPLQPFFEQASVQTGVDWRLLAALAYQESQWNPRAESPNGAQGIMMLMPQTARSLGVKNPLDPRESILAGARYFVQVREQIPARIPEPDRSWFAIAAYNIGYGHLESARVITQLRKLNPDRWIDVRTSLPLLSEPQWHERVKTGYARGWEAAYTVDRVQQFANVLAWRSTQSPPAVNASPDTVLEAPAVPQK